MWSWSGHPRDHQASSHLHHRYAKILKCSLHIFIRNRTMACCFGGYPQYRFQSAVDKNFFCPICTEVLKEPLQCHNQHYFCKTCITEHLKNSKTCPICCEKVTEDSVSTPPRIVTDYLNGLIIECDNRERGCSELVELGSFENHTSTVCSYRAVACPNERCETTVIMKDLEEHKTELCEYRLIYCHECDEKMSVKKYGKHACLLMNEMHEMKTLLLEVKNEVTKISKNQNQQNEKMSDIQHTLERKFNDLVKDIPHAASDKESKEQNASAQVQQAHSSSTEVDKSIMVLGGNNRMSLNTAEMYSISSQSWCDLLNIKECRVSSTAHYYDGKIFVIGGHSKGLPIGSIEYMDLIERQWLPFPQHLPVECHGHRSVIHNGCLWVIGGMLVRQPCSNMIHEMLLNPPYTSKCKCTLQQPLSYHGAEVSGNNILILGGSTSGYPKDAVKNVWLYSMVHNRIQEVQALPFPIMDMATVKYGEEILVIGGRNQKNEILNSVLAFNYKKSKCRQLPNMRHKRAECAAVISGNTIYVMGGINCESRYLSSVECLDLTDQVWKDLPPMSEPKNKICAVLMPTNPQ